MLRCVVRVVVGSKRRHRTTEPNAVAIREAPLPVRKRLRHNCNMIIHIAFVPERIHPRDPLLKVFVVHRLHHHRVDCRCPRSSLLCGRVRRRLHKCRVVLGAQYRPVRHIEELRAVLWKRCARYQNVKVHLRRQRARAGRSRVSRVDGEHRRFDQRIGSVAECIQ